ncbi:MAG: hypothetical protein Q4A27_00410 [bacterium]|nr:hypothetical protein [bacterium]
MTNKNYNSISERIVEKDPSKKYKQISSYAKIYPDFIRIVKYKKPIITDGFATISDGFANEEKEPERDSLEKSINRTKTKISDLILCNKFTHFATFTFDPNNSLVNGEENRHNFQKMSRLLINWLNTEQINHKRNHGEKFAYLIVPERHKNGAWHFHALLKNYKNETADFYSSKNPFITVSELKNPKRPAYRKFLLRYDLGRSEVEPIRDQTKMSSYIKKYITKDLIVEKNVKRFWCSKGLERPEIIENFIDERTEIPELFKVCSHDYHDIYEIPSFTQYFEFLGVAQEVHLHARKEKNKWFWANS